jgi:hypothetical protein
MLDSPALAEFVKLTILEELRPTISVNGDRNGEPRNQRLNVINDLLCGRSFATLEDVGKPTVLVYTDQELTALIARQIHVDELKRKDWLFVMDKPLLWVGRLVLLTWKTGIRHVLDITCQKRPPNGLPGSGEHLVSTLMHGQKSLKIGFSQTFWHNKAVTSHNKAIHIQR